MHLQVFYYFLKFALTSIENLELSTVRIRKETYSMQNIFWYTLKKKVETGNWTKLLFKIEGINTAANRRLARLRIL